MSAASIGATNATATAPDRAERLRRTARDLEGVFVEQLFKAMRETVPEGGLVESGSGQEMFTALLDQKLSANAPDRWRHGLTEALVRQLAAGDSRHAGEAAGTGPASIAPTRPDGEPPITFATSSSPVAVPPILHPSSPPDVPTTEPT